MFECVHILGSYTNLIVSDILIIWLVIRKKISQCARHSVCYLDSWCVCVLCMHVMLFYAIRRKGPARAGWCEDGVWLYALWYERRGRQDPIGAKTGYDFVCCVRKKGLAGAGRCEDGVWLCVLWYEGRAGGSRWVWRWGMRWSICYRVKKWFIQNE